MCLLPSPLTGTGTTSGVTSGPLDRKGVGERLPLGRDLGTTVPRRLRGAETGVPPRGRRPRVRFLLQQSGFEHSQTRRVEVYLRDPGLDGRSRREHQVVRSRTEGKELRTDRSEISQRMI